MATYNPEGPPICSPVECPIAVGKPPVACRSLEYALERVSPKISKTESWGRHNAIANQPVLEEWPASKIQPKHSVSSTGLEGTIGEQIDSIPAMVEEAVVRFFEDACKFTESNTDTRVISMARMVVNGAVDKRAGFQCDDAGCKQVCIRSPNC